MAGGVRAVGGWKLDVLTVGSDSDGVAMEILFEILVRFRASQRPLECAVLRQGQTSKKRLWNNKRLQWNMTSRQAPAIAL